MGRDHEASSSQGQQIVFPHHPQNPLVIHLHSPPAQLRTDPSVPIAAAMFQSNLLNPRPYLRLFLGWPLLLEKSVETCPAHSGQLTHALDTQAALQGHHFSDLLVDAVSPEASLFRRRASIFCKAPLKKSTSSVFSARSRFSASTSGPAFEKPTHENSVA